MVISNHLGLTFWVVAYERLQDICSVPEVACDLHAHLLNNAQWQWTRTWASLQNPKTAPRQEGTRLATTCFLFNLAYILLAKFKKPIDEQVLALARMIIKFPNNKLSLFVLFYLAFHGVWQTGNGRKQH